MAEAAVEKHRTELAVHILGFVDHGLERFRNSYLDLNDFRRICDLTKKLFLNEETYQKLWEQGSLLTLQQVLEEVNHL